MEAKDIEKIPWLPKHLSIASQHECCSCVEYYEPINTYGLCLNWDCQVTFDNCCSDFKPKN